MHIKSDSQIVQQQLELTAKTVVENGGFIHPALCITHQGERLWISCSAESDGCDLLMVPDELFIPVTQLEWTSENGVLSYTGNTSQLSPVQQSLLDAMVLLYNATNKIIGVAEKLPAQQLTKDQELLTWLKDTRPAFELPKTNSARQFIQTRLNDKNIQPESGEPIGYLMPLIDLLNHHPYSPKYERTDCGAWLIPLVKPNPGSDECFVRYGKSDCLSLAMWHNYFEPNTRHVAALDCALMHVDLGEIRIKGTNASRRKINAPRLLPNEPILTLQDLVLEKEQLQTLRTLLGLAVRSKRHDLNQDKAEVIADELIVLLIEANKKKYAELLTLCQKDTELFPLRTLFGQVAEHQLALLSGLRTL